MLSFLDDTCQQLAEGVARQACQWTVTNPALVMGITAGAALMGGGLYFFNRGSKVTASTNNKPVVARLARESVMATISAPVAPVVPVANVAVVANSEVFGKMPVQTIVLEALTRQKRNPATSEIALRLWDLRRTEKQRLDEAALQKLNLPVTTATLNVKVDQVVLAKLGLPPTGVISTAEQQTKYEQVLGDLNLTHLNKFR